jgi:periplasmic protein TonB
VSVKGFILQHPVIDELGPVPRQEARRKFQRYFFTALLIAATLHFAVIFGGIGVQAFMNRKKAEEATRQVKLVPYRDISAPPSLDAKPPEPPKFAFKAPEFKAPPSGIPVPVPKEEAVKTTIASQEQNPFASAQGDTGLGSDLSAGVPWGVEGGGDLVIEEEVLPNPDDFVAVEQQPVLVEKPPPVYPELAQMAKIEGTVIVRVLVGKDGKVKDAILGKGVNDILDQSALAAARNYVFQPAMQNKKPVAVWVAIPFKFSLY